MAKEWIYIDGGRLRLSPARLAVRILNCGPLSVIHADQVEQITDLCETLCDEIKAILATALDEVKNDGP